MPALTLLLHQAVALHAVKLSDAAVLVTYSAELCSEKLLLCYALCKGLHGLNVYKTSCMNEY